MKVVILAGGFGTRIASESQTHPKPMVEVGGKPFLWHILKLYSFYNFREFLVLCGYKKEVILDYFIQCGVGISTQNIRQFNTTIECHESTDEKWKVTLIDSGLYTNTGGRIRQVQPYLNQEKNFLLTYADCIGDINIQNTITFHEKHNGMVTMTATNPPSRYGIATIDKNLKISHFAEKPKNDGNWINGGFFVVREDIFSLLDNEESSWENNVLPQLAADGQLYAYKHDGFWRPMDTLRERNELNEMWINKSAPWKTWN